MTDNNPRHGSHATPGSPATTGTPVQITLNAVLAALEAGHPQTLCVQAIGPANDIIMALPYGPFDPLEHRTFEIGIRDWVNRQTKVTLGYVEQLYTFGDRGREGTGRSLGRSLRPREDGKFHSEAGHLVSVGYLALASDPAPVDVKDARWCSWYRFFPWEDWRHGEPASLKNIILPALKQWIDRTEETKRRTRLQNRFLLAFGLNDMGWEEERILERFELMYEARLVAEAPEFDTVCATSEICVDVTGLPMASDHRRILATAIARLRGKLKYRPVAFEMMPPAFTLFDLQRGVEAIIGFGMHKQNFRRSVEASGMVERTGEMSAQTGGRPAALFRVNRRAVRDKAATGLVIPRLRLSPSLP